MKGVVAFSPTPVTTRPASAVAPVHSHSAGFQAARLSSIRPAMGAGNAIGRQGGSDYAGAGSLLRPPSARAATRLFANTPGVIDVQGEPEEIGPDANNDVFTVEPEAFYADVLPGEIADASEKQPGHLTDNTEGAVNGEGGAPGGIGRYFMKPLQAMSHSIRNQFESFTKPKAETPKEFGPEYGRAMANHLPMALSALRQLGASAEVIAQFEADYLARTPLRDVSDQTTELSGDPAMVFGRRDYFVALRNTFQAYQAEHGTDALLNLWVPKLTEGMSASAFHAVIRLGYALNDGDSAEIVNALAFWASGFQSLGRLDTFRAENPKGTAEVGPILEKVAQDPELGHQTLKGGGIASRLGRAARLPGYDRLVETINLSGKFSLDDLRDQSLNVFLHDPSFTTLHLVTGAEGLDQVAGKVAAPQSLLQHYALALANVYISRGTPALEDADKIKDFATHEDLPDWDYLKTEAIASGDEHKIKFVQTCASEFEKTGDSRYQLAAGVWLSGKQPWLGG